MTAYIKFPDEHLVALLKNGDQLAFAEIYRRYGKNLAGFAASKLYDLEDARDLLQEMFVKLWENREQLQITSNLQSYLFAILRHRIIDKIRKNITREDYARALQSLPSFFQAGGDKQLEAKELQQAVRHSLDQLPARVREIYKLSREDGLSNPEIAQKLKLSEQTVKNQLSTALKHLRKSLMRISPIVFICWWLH
ncbi:RNA polymerase sigma factor [Mucilaginibacter gotjawali]|uniref:RNA polymerase sigma-70 factor (ECF subfamily) n=2 Tax=Mucilaginibacter gotjawali TaxID=1550579 RepID=A0A839SKJ0_9SPHI|nr:RNA polymerase sigma-70 factor [Mucilaginibacter gotjawali]MBB3056987.1 RNA polymerase sigma-70 factor (ECF subfamily) [Mucilaginibacter gotjawali]BAU56066.1 putative RNA polymerase sigma factor FecI [Mucilaginibacter gotjawali]